MLCCSVIGTCFGDVMKSPSVVVHLMQDSDDDSVFIFVDTLDAISFDSTEFYPFSSYTPVSLLPPPPPPPWWDNPALPIALLLTLGLALTWWQRRAQVHDLTRYPDSGRIDDDLAENGRTE